MWIGVALLSVGVLSILLLQRHDLEAVLALPG